MLIDQKDLNHFVSKKNLVLHATFLFPNQLTKEELTERSIEEIKGAFPTGKPIILFCGNENNSMQIYKVNMNTKLNGIQLKKNHFFCVCMRRDLLK